MADITYTVEVALGGTLTDVTSLVDGFTCTSGRQREFESFPPGSATFTIDDRTGDYIPDAGGTYSTETWVGRDVRLSAAVGGSTMVLWAGQVEDIDIEVEGFFGATVTVSAVEPHASLGRAEIDASTSFSSELSSTRIENVLALSEVTAPAETDIGVGVVTLQSESDAGGNALQYLQTVEQSENGRLFIRNGGAVGGVLTFRSGDAGGRDLGVKFVDSAPTAFVVLDGGTATTSTFTSTYDGGDATS